jgi:hypothetical protein
MHFELQHDADGSSGLCYVLPDFIVCAAVSLFGEPQPQPDAPKYSWRWRFVADDPRGYCVDLYDCHGVWRIGAGPLIPEGASWRDTPSDRDHARAVARHFIAFLNVHEIVMEHETLAEHVDRLTAETPT